MSAKSSDPKSYALSWVLLTALGVLIMTTSGAIILVQVFASASALDKLADRLVRSNIQIIERNIQDHLKPASTLVGFLAREVSSGRYDISDETRLRPLLTGAIAGADQIGSILIIDTSLSAVRLVRHLRQREYVIDRADLADEPGIEAAMMQAAGRREPYWGEVVYISRAGHSYMNARAPIWRGDVFLGVVVAAVSLLDLSAFAEEVSSRTDSVTFIMYGPDRVLAHPHLFRNPPPLDEQTPVVPVDRLGDAVVRDFALGSAERLMEEILPADIAVNLIENEAGRHYVTSRALDIHGDVKLTAAAYIDAAAAEAPWRTFIRSTLFGLFVLVLALVAAAILSRRISRPVARAATAARAVGRLDFDAIEAMPASRVRELDDLASAFNRMLDGIRLFARYVPNRLVRKLIAGGQFGAGSEQRELTIMFTDIRGFTRLSEGLSAQAVADFINHHLTLLSECVEAENGTIDKYIGDALMAFWGAPEVLDNTANAAARAALRMKQAIAEDNAKRVAAGLEPVGVRIGIHTGQIIVGDIGSPSRINYTVVGDAVNVTQRLENLGREVDNKAETIILISEETRALLRDEFLLKTCGSFTLKGRAGRKEVWRLLGTHP